MKKPNLSLVIPCFNEEETIPRFYEESNKVLSEMNISESSEFIFIDDGSDDNTIETLRNLSEKDSRVHYISFSRNFGKEAAIYAGLSKATGLYTALLDADLQDPPSLLPQMLAAVKNEGFDCAASRRATRENEPLLRSYFARLFYKIMGKLSDVPVVDGARDFRLMSELYKKAVLSLCEKNRFTKGIFPWVGFKTEWFSYNNIERVAGKTKWSFWKLFLYSIDGIIGFSTKPLAFSAITGILAIFFSLFLIVFLILRKIIFNNSIEGWASLVCIIIFFSGIQLFSIGIIGLYLSKMYTEIKQRPLYIVKEEK